MTTKEITQMLENRLTTPLQPLPCASPREILLALCSQLGEEALSLTEGEIHCYRDEVQAMFEHYGTKQDIYEMAFSSWQITRHL